ncbi:MAG: hypothetical protein A7316_00600 [Candidatus Altiarchaeales archaeon WOR_SM1_86-2]|nr:MAG: hypothetical protein A7316_00600 [Candidatus Altiarchaeales archaeon WOR_SM1_86-2]ODS41777.1 MAG: hypothetical protein A7315_00240 [Candidatus Altiarchaeales archaeon WOR_SM1_79]
MNNLIYEIIKIRFKKLNIMNIMNTNPFGPGSGLFPSHITGREEVQIECKGMNIKDVKGLSEYQIKSLKERGAVD